MQYFRFLSAITALAFLFTFAVSPATAGSMGNGAAQRQKLVVDSVDVASGTVVLKSMVDQTVHTYKIDATTRVNLVNSKGTIDQIQPGMKVFNYTVKGGHAPGDGQTLSFIGVSPAAPTNTAPGAGADRSQPDGANPSQILRTMSGPS